MNTDLLQETILKAQNGSSVAMAALYDEYYERIAHYALRRVLDQHIAEDITANVFVKVLDKLPRFTWRHEHSFNGWIFRIASNEVNQYFRKQTRYEFVPPGDIDDLYASVSEHNHTSATLEYELDMHRDFVALHNCIATLKPKQQDIVHLFYFENLSTREIAGALRMAEGSVRVTLSRTTKKLNKLLNQKGVTELVTQKG